MQPAVPANVEASGIGARVPERHQSGGFKNLDAAGVYYQIYMS
jgi:hypothetical protein